MQVAGNSELLAGLQRFIKVVIASDPALEDEWRSLMDSYPGFDAAGLTPGLWAASVLQQRLKGTLRGWV